MCRLNLLLLNLLLGLGGYCQDKTCDLKKESDGIRVYTCKTENEKFKSIRAEFELKKISVAQVKDFLWRVDNYTTWQYNAIEAETVSTNGNNELTYRAIIHAPWPVSNRELVLKMKMSVAESDSIFLINVASFDKPVPDGVVRVPFFQADWAIEKSGQDLKIVYSLKIDPGGSIPAWLVNMAVADGPHESFRDLKKQLEAKLN